MPRSEQLRVEKRLGVLYHTPLKDWAERLERLKAAKRRKGAKAK